MKIIFEAQLSKNGNRQIIIIPLSASEKLPSRGMVMVQGTINKIPFNAALEPDGKGSHWFEVGNKLIEEAQLKVGEIVDLMIEPLKIWSEPEIPNDIMDEIDKAKLIDKWNSITTKARWDWLRWIRATANPETRKKRIAVACSKLQNGDNNPCCFDRTRCTIPDVSKSGTLVVKSHF